MTTHLGDVFDAVGAAMPPDAAAIICDGEVLTWAAFNHRSNALARRLLAAGLQTQSKVGIYMRNGPDYMIGLAAALKARLAPFNINFRYGANEVGYLLDNADCEAVIFDAEFGAVLAAAPGVERLRIRLVSRGEAPGAELLSDVWGRDGAPLTMTRDPQDIFLLYTGGTTGMPKGVMWTSEAMWLNMLPGLALPGRPPPATLSALTDQVRTGEGDIHFYIAPPLMHGTGQFSAMNILCRGGTVVLSGRPSFDAEAVLRDLEAYGCAGMTIVGDAFARPILDVLTAAPGRYDVSRMRAVVSSGMMWSPEVKEGLLEFMPQALMIDGLGASESSGFASSTTTKGQSAEAARFELTGAIVVDPETLERIEPGSGKVGILAKSGPLPLGYYKDPEKTGRTYVTLDGVRYVLGGDHATIEADGSIRLLGRGSHCINTAGEKVYPEEVEEALKTHPSVRDALVFGLPDPRLGQSVAAVAAASRDVTPEDLIAHVRRSLAGYKAPRQLVLVDAAPRAANGKADYPKARSLFEAALKDAEGQGGMAAHDA